MKTYELAISVFSGIREQILGGKSGAWRLLKDLATGDNVPKDEQRILKALRQASKQWESGTDSFVVDACTSIKPDAMEKIAETHGTGFVYHLLVSVAIDSGIDAVISALALNVLVATFGEESLYMDDRLGAGLFTQKTAGSFKDPTMQMLLGPGAEGPDDFAVTNLLISIYEMLNSDQRNRLLEMAKNTGERCERLEILIEYWEGRLDPDQFQKKMEKTKRKDQTDWKKLRAKAKQKGIDEKQWSETEKALRRRRDR